MLYDLFSTHHFYDFIYWLAEITLQAKETTNNLHTINLCDHVTFVTIYFLTNRQTF